MSRQSNDTFTRWLKTSAPNYGARDFLSGRLAKRAVPFIPIQNFGFVLDEAPNEWRVQSCGPDPLRSPGGEHSKLETDGR